MNDSPSTSKNSPTAKAQSGTRSPKQLDYSKAGDRFLPQDASSLTPSKLRKISDLATRLVKAEREIKAQGKK